MTIRKAVHSDRDDIRDIYLSGFPDTEKDIVARLALDLLDQHTTPETLSLVAESRDNVIGHVAFSPVQIENNDDLQGYILAPLGIKPGFRKQGAGSRLVETGVDILKKMKTDIVFVYGDPEYYRRFGFNAEDAEIFIPRHRLQYPEGWQAHSLNRTIINDLPVTISCVSSLENPLFW